MDISFTDNPNNYDTGFILADLDIPIWDSIQSLVNENDISVNGSGRETNPHCTILANILCIEEGYSLEKVRIEVTANILEHFTHPLSMYMSGGLEVFSNKDSDVLKYRVISNDILSLHTKLKETLGTKQTFPNFSPHITVAYLKPGAGKKYERLHRQGLKIEANTLIHSDPKGTVKYSLFNY